MQMDSEVSATTLNTFATHKPALVRALLDVHDYWSQVAQLETANGNGYEWAVHFCDAAGTNCAPSTGFVVNGSQPVPKPPVKGLLAGATLLFGGLLRRWL